MLCEWWQKPGTKDYGALSVAVQYYTEPDIVLDVPPKSFLPAPAVTSSVIRCVLRDKPPVDVIDEKLFFRVVKAGFAQRRKNIFQYHEKQRAYQKIESKSY